MKRFYQQILILVGRDWVHREKFDGLSYRALNPPFAIRIYYIFIPSAFLKFLVGAKHSTRTGWNCESLAYWIASPLRLNIINPKSMGVTIWFLFLACWNEGRSPRSLRSLAMTVLRKVLFMADWKHTNVSAWWWKQCFQSRPTGKLFFRCIPPQFNGDGEMIFLRTTNNSAHRWSYRAFNLSLQRLVFSNGYNHLPCRCLLK